MKRLVLALSIASLLAAPVFADVVHLEGGGRLTGEIVRENEGDIVIRVADGTLTIPRERITKIERDDPRPDPDPGPDPDPDVPPQDDPRPPDRPDDPGVRERVDRTLETLAGRDVRQHQTALRVLHDLCGGAKSHAVRRRIAREVIAYLRTAVKPELYWVGRVLRGYLDAFTPRELVAAGNGKRSEVRLVVATTLQHMDGRAASSALVSFLTDGDSRVRDAAAKGLEGRSDAAPALVGLVGHPDAELRAIILDLLLALSGSDVEGALCRAFPDVGEADRLRIAGRLGQLRSRTGFATLAARLARDPSAKVRRACAKALGRIGGAAAEAKLVSALAAEKDASVRSEIEKAVKVVRGS